VRQNGGIQASEHFDNAAMVAISWLELAAKKIGTGRRAKSRLPTP
jgi:hypothetical protein